MEKQSPEGESLFRATEEFADTLKKRGLSTRVINALKRAVANSGNENLLDREYLNSLTEGDLYNSWNLTHGHSGETLPIIGTKALKSIKRALSRRTTNRS